MNRQEMKAQELRMKTLDQIVALPEPHRTAVAYRCVLRVFPIVGGNGNFDYWADAQAQKIHFTTLLTVMKTVALNNGASNHRTAEVYAAYADLAHDAYMAVKPKAGEATRLAVFAVYLAALSHAATYAYYAVGHVATFAAANAAYAAALYADRDDDGIAVEDAAVAAKTAEADAANFIAKAALMRSLGSAADAHTAAYSGNFSTEVQVDLGQALAGIDPRSLPLWRHEPPQYKQHLSKFEQATRLIGLEWGNVYDVISDLYRQR